MAKVTASSDVDQSTTLEDVKKYTDLALQDILAQINGSLSFAENIECRVIQVIFVTANIDFPIRHTLGRVANNFIVASKSASCDIYNGSTLSTNNTIFLRSTIVPVTVTLVVF